MKSKEQKMTTNFELFFKKEKKNSNWVFPFPGLERI